MSVLGVLNVESTVVARAVRAVVTREHVDDDGIDLAARSGYTVGLEVGLAIAVADIASGRRLLEFITDVVQEGDAAALADRIHSARAFLQAIER